MSKIIAYPSRTDVYPADIQPEQIHLEDICNALSHMPRFAGHTPVLHTVAEHSVRVYDIVALNGGTWNEQGWALAHDFSEAYVMDMPKPIKDLPEMEPYRNMEYRIQAVIATRFGLSPMIPDIVHAADAERGRIDLTVTRYSTESWSSYAARYELMRCASVLGFR